MFDHRPLFKRGAVPEPTATLSLVGKLFPTTKETEEEQKKERVQTASFITQSALGGLKVASIFDAKLLNAPEIYPLSLQGFLRLALTLLAFRTVDSHKTERQLYEVAEAGAVRSSPRNILASCALCRSVNSRSATI